MSEIRDKVADTIIDVKEAFDKESYLTEDLAPIELAYRILSIPEIAIVSRRMALPFSTNESIWLLEKVREELDMPIMTPEYQVLNYLINVIKAGWVEEEK